MVHDPGNLTIMTVLQDDEQLRGGIPDKLARPLQRDFRQLYGITMHAPR